MNRWDLNLDDNECTDEQSNLIDPDPISIILEIANLVFQPGSLALLANVSASAAAIGSVVISYKQLSQQKQSEIRRKLYEIDRALTKGFAVLETLASLLHEYNYIERSMIIGGAPIKGFTNAQTLRRVHEDCRSAVKDARDAFMDLSGLLPLDHAEVINETIVELNKLASVMLRINQPYGIFLEAAADALGKVDSFICRLGKNYDYNRLPRNFHDDLIVSFPELTHYKTSRN